MTRTSMQTSPTPAVDALRPALTPADLGIGVSFSTVLDGMIAGDAATGQIVLWSPSAAEIFEYPVDEAVGMLLYALIPPGPRERHRLG